MTATIAAGSDGMPTAAQQQKCFDIREVPGADGKRYDFGLYLGVDAASAIDLAANCFGSAAADVDWLKGKMVATEIPTPGLVKANWARLNFFTDRGVRAFLSLMCDDKGFYVILDGKDNVNAPRFDTPILAMRDACLRWADPVWQMESLDDHGEPCQPA
ncbi:hypothetical protein [Noviherbaspirillum aerium]|uniref:hypothetical protein n=1 Tax=Noviherbaspirillum aerium TaxID=2588497 RepID=UPI00124BDDA0|nr:hypothetical protein [Noviherbaspirillum aerium]